MEVILAGIKANIEVFALTSFVLGIITLFLLILNLWRTGRMIRKYNTLMKGVDGKRLEDMLTLYVEAVNKAVRKTGEVEDAYRGVRDMAERCVQHVGVVRFNAFEDTGSDLSYAIALLDNHGDGVVMSSLFGRNETRTYAKPVAGGRSPYLLSDEEQEAIRKAMNK